MPGLCDLWMGGFISYIKIKRGSSFEFGMFYSYECKVNEESKPLIKLLLPHLLLLTFEFMEIKPPFTLFNTKQKNN